jgi:carboxypeptidase Taq
MDARTAYAELVRLLRERAVLASVSSLLSWDEETVMPRGGTAHRARQHAAIAGLVHERISTPVVGDLLGRIEPLCLTEVENANVRLIRRLHDRARKIPRSLVEKIASTVTLAQDAWRNARREARFATFEPWLEQVVRLKRDEAKALGTPVLYDALLDEFEPGFTCAQLDAVFVPLEREIQRVLSRRNRAPLGRAPLRRRVAAEAQQAFALETIRAMGFDLERGRVDPATHPSTIGVGPGDVRITTRVAEDDCTETLFCALHEFGHWLYETNLPGELWGQPAGEAISLGLHESQSRLFENQIGRGRPFWTWCFPRIRKAFSPALDDVSLDDMLRAVTHVEPSPIRTAADEVTYNLHVFVRYRLERALLEADLPIADLPAAWDEAYEKTLGVAPRNDAEGCLQDGHWSAGMFGYFPTYALGNVVAAQLYAAAEQASPRLDDAIARGEFVALTSWLRDNLHARGSTLPLASRLEAAAGTALHIEAYGAYLKGRYSS